MLSPTFFLAYLMLCLTEARTVPLSEPIPPSPPCLPESSNPYLPPSALHCSFFTVDCSCVKAGLLHSLHLRHKHHYANCHAVRTKPQCEQLTFQSASGQMAMYLALYCILCAPAHILQATSYFKVGRHTQMHMQSVWLCVQLRLRCIVPSLLQAH